MRDTKRDQSNAQATFGGLRLLEHSVRLEPSAAKSSHPVEEFGSRSTTQPSHNQKAVMLSAAKHLLFGLGCGEKQIPCCARNDRVKGFAVREENTVSWYSGNLWSYEFW